MTDQSAAQDQGVWKMTDAEFKAELHEEFKRGFRAGRSLQALDALIAEGIEYKEARALLDEFRNTGASPTGEPVSGESRSGWPLDQAPAEHPPAASMLRRYRNTPGGMKYGPRVHFNRVAFSVQWWNFWPKFVLTLWWWPLRLRLYYWRGQLRTSGRLAAKEGDGGDA